MAKLIDQININADHLGILVVYLSWIHELPEYNCLILHSKGVYPNYMQPYDTLNSFISLFTGISTVS